MDLFVRSDSSSFLPSTHNFSISNNLGVKGVIFSSALSSLFSLISDYFNSRKYSKFKLFGGLNLDKAFVASALILL